MEAAQAPASSQARRDFDNALFSHVGHIISNAVRAFMLALTGGHATRAPVRGKTARYYRQVTRMSAAFALVADGVLLTLGGKFKFKETLSGRFADVLIHLYLVSACLKRFEDDGRPEEDLPLVAWAVEDSLQTVQERLIGILENFPVPILGGVLRFLVFPLGRSYSPPSDRTMQQVARVLQSENDSRDRLTSGVYHSDADDATGRVAAAFHLVLESAEAETAIRNATGETVSVDNYESLVKRAVESGVINEEQASLVRLAQEAALKVISVDDFPKSHIEGFEQPAFRPAVNETRQKTA
jgi:acyl-CoA dehydrogenase